MGDPCNRNNMMGHKPSTRVHAAPGGQSSFSLGWDDDVCNLVPSSLPTHTFHHTRANTQKPKPAPKINKADAYNAEVQVSGRQTSASGGEQVGGLMGGQAPPPQQQQQPPPQQQQAPATGSKPTSSNAWASNSNQNCGNMISERPSTRIHAPPGGKSSITF